MARPLAASSTASIDAEPIETVALLPDHPPSLSPGAASAAA